MKISVITPTYNDAQSINQTYLSLKSQTVKDWEWIVINDGSTDNTNSILENFAANEPQNKIIWKEQKNSDQLNAIIHGLEYVTGDYIFILHSDDLLPCDDFFEKALSFLNRNPETDGIFGDLIIINENNEQTGVQTLKEYVPSKGIPPLQLLWLGRNLYSDCALHKTAVFKEQVLNNYLIWNTPLWLDLTKSKADMINYKKADFPLLKYRVHSGNYINNEIGKLNVINGELRTAIKLMFQYSIPSYSLQYLIFRLCNRLKIGYIPLYLNKPTAAKDKIIRFIVQKRYDSPEDNAFIKSLYCFYKSKSKRTLAIKQLPADLPVYYGKDVRAFNKKLLENNLEPFYTEFMTEMQTGFSEILLENGEDLEKLQVILKFFCIENVKIKISERN